MTIALTNPNVEAEYRANHHECPVCGHFNLIHETTIYYKCKGCGNGVDLRSETYIQNDESYVVVDWGKTADSKWVKVMDHSGNVCTYWKED